MADPLPAQSRMPPPQPVQLAREDYRALSDFRYLIRRFLEFSQKAAGQAGLTSRHHQALLAIKGFPRDDSPTIGDLAERLRIQHHSAVELVDRLAEAGLIVRTHDPQDRRRVLLGLTEAAEERLASLSAIHLEELTSLRPALLEILNRAGSPRQGGRQVAESAAGHALS
ncbi:MAG TPA: MarR family winged helix-turn-helix transcriptional regulator [Stellaceae bacterium]|nr:MarR family winged helix-turn-helix transcriptional regulator [Stellaceae bacterium]